MQTIEEKRLEYGRYLYKHGGISEQCEGPEGDFTLPVLPLPVPVPETKTERYTATFYEGAKTGILPRTKVTTDSHDVVEEFVQCCLSHPVVTCRNLKDGILYETWTGDGYSFVLVESICKR